MTDWSTATLVDTADAIASGRTSARNVMEACLDRYQSIGDTIGCFVSIDLDEARKAADQADQILRSGRSVGALHGVPVAHKDMYYRDNRISSCGSRLRQDFIPETTATVLEHLDAAGAIEIGRLVMVEFAMGPHGYNQNYPLCRNPWNTDYIPCGSSSGSGASVAARMVHAALGSDTGGSVRCPAAVNGVVGLLPTYGRVSRHGMMPMSFSLDAPGPLARTAKDCARLLRTIAGPDTRDASTLHSYVPDYEAAIDAMTPLPRIGIARGYFDRDLHPEVAKGTDDAAEVFARIGFDIVDVVIPEDLVDEVAEIHPVVMKSEGAANHMDTMRTSQDEYTFEVRNRLHAGFFIPAANYIRALKLRGIYLREFAASVFSKCDLLLTPVLTTPVPTIAETSNKRGKDYLDMVVTLTRNTKIVNYFGLPAISVPCGFTSNGLPAALQLIGRPLAEAQLLRSADRFQRETDWHRREPALVQKAA